MFGRYLKSKLIGNQGVFNDEKGMTLVEVVIAFFILSLVTLLMVQGVMIATRANEINKSKTEAIALINNEVEEIRLRDYDEVGIEGAPEGEPQGSLEAESEVNGYTVKRKITWVEDEYSYKQIEISADNDEMTEEISVVTQVYPHFGEGGPPPGHPPVTNLAVDGIWFFIWIEIQVTWDAPETEASVDYYEVYRDGSSHDTTYNTSYTEYLVAGRHHEYYIVVWYDDGECSDPSETVSTD